MKKKWEKKYQTTKLTGKNPRSGSQIVKQALLTKNPHCDVCGTSKSLELHHVYPVRYGYKTDFNRCVLLCANCHSAFHSKWDKYIDSLITENPNVNLMKVYNELKKHL